MEWVYMMLYIFVYIHTVQLVCVGGDCCATTTSVLSKSHSIYSIQGQVCLCRPSHLQVLQLCHSWSAASVQLRVRALENTQLEGAPRVCAVLRTAGCSWSPQLRSVGWPKFCCKIIIQNTTSYSHCIQSALSGASTQRCLYSEWRDVLAVCSLHRDHIPSILLSLSSFFLSSLMFIIGRMSYLVSLTSLAFNSCIWCEVCLQHWRSSSQNNASITF